ncbi:MAG: hypothetical protein A3F46_06860 [Legionellales bacterium RIFCSPHIGHO2_12_FULL_42_9]|nr:MAG: hypothetical protein A3F46_06860 [Legionellales bacterium RIFCSPHIGHO2_12_FULL_42_9]
MVNFTKNKGRRKFDRSLLPAPAAYYSQEIPNLKIKSEWAQTHCCFHDDSNPSLSLNMKSGHFRCFGCGAKGGDIIAFHMLRYGLTFIEAVNYFGAWSHG